MPCMAEQVYNYLIVLQIQNVPKYMTVTVTRFIKPLSQAYLDLATACSTNNSADAQNVLSKYHETFTR